MDALMTYLQQCPIELVTALIAAFALYVSFLSKYYAEKTFTLALFDKRYKTYYDFKNFLNDVLSNFEEKDLSQAYLHLNQVKFLLWETQYIFGKDVNDLLTKIKSHIGGGVIKYISLYEKAEAGAYFPEEDISLMEECRVKSCEPLESLISTLLFGDDSVNLNAYFHKYLEDADFRKPIKISFWKKFLKLIAWPCSCCGYRKE